MESAFSAVAPFCVGAFCMGALLGWLVWGTRGAKAGGLVDKRGMVHIASVAVAMEDTIDRMVADGHFVPADRLRAVKIVTTKDNLYAVPIYEEDGDDEQND